MKVVTLTVLLISTLCIAKGDPGPDSCYADNPVEFPQPPVRKSVDGYLKYPIDIVYMNHRIDIVTPTIGVGGTTNGTEIIAAGGVIGPAINYFGRSFNDRLGMDTIVVKVGDRLQIPYCNKLPNNVNYNVTDQNSPHNFNTINLHFHGSQVSPIQDNVIISIQPGECYTYTYDLQLEQSAGTMWFHPHQHGATSVHLFSGLVGAAVIEGTDKHNNGDLNFVPEIADAEDVIFKISELNLVGWNNGQSNPSPTPPGHFELQTFQTTEYTRPRPFSGSNSLYLVNDLYNPLMKIIQGKAVRLRIVNAATRKAVKFFIQGESQSNKNKKVPFVVAARDGNTQYNTIDVPDGQILLAPGNRADILLRFNSTGAYTIRLDVGGGNVRIVATVEVTAPVCGQPQPIYQGALPHPPIARPFDQEELDRLQNRTLRYEANNAGGPPATIGTGSYPDFTINDKRFDHNRVDQYIDEGDVIHWDLINVWNGQSGGNPSHPHHIHIFPYQVYQTSDNMLNGLPFPPPGALGHMPVWLDTTLIPSPNTKKNPGANGWVKAKQRWPRKGFYGETVLHCHILPHEDVGMMQLISLSTSKKSKKSKKTKKTKKTKKSKKT